MAHPGSFAVGVLAILWAAFLQAAEVDTSKWKSHALGKGQAVARAPSDYQAVTEPKQTLALTPPNNPGVTLRFNLHYVEGEQYPDDAAEGFVKSQAKNKNQPVIEKDGKVYLTETNTGEENGEKVERRFWQIGFGRALVVMSATVVTSKKDAPAVKECLETIVPAVIQSLAKK